MKAQDPDHLPELGSQRDMNMTDDLAAKKPRTRQPCEAVGVFMDPAALRTAVNELESSGFDRANISVLGSDAEIRKRVGHLYRNVTEIEDDARAPRTSFVSGSKRVEDSRLQSCFPYTSAVSPGSPLSLRPAAQLALAFGAAIVGSAVGVSLGGLLAGAIAQHHAERIAEQIAQGGLVLWVKVADNDAEGHALAVLEKTGARDVHIHEIERKGRATAHPTRRARASRASLPPTAPTRQA